MMMMMVYGKMSIKGDDVRGYSCMRCSCYIIILHITLTLKEEQERFEGSQFHTIVSLRPEELRYFLPSLHTIFFFSCSNRMHLARN